MNDFMKYAKAEAMIGMNNGEIPVGAVVVKDGIVIGRGHNLKETNNDATAHAEILAIKQASEVIGDWRLNGCEMYVTLEPCPMCAGAIIQSRIDKVYIGTFNKDMGACGTLINILESEELNSSVKVEWVYDKECLDLLKEFFYNKRRNIE